MEIGGGRSCSSERTKLQWRTKQTRLLMTTDEADGATAANGAYEADEGDNEVANGNKWGCNG